MSTAVCSNCPQAQKIIDDLKKENERLKIENEKLKQDKQTEIKELKSLTDQVIVLSEQTKILDQNICQEKVTTYLKELEVLTMKVNELKCQVNLEANEKRTLQNENNRLREDNLRRAQPKQSEEEKNDQGPRMNENKEILSFLDNRIPRENLKNFYDCRIDADSFYTLLREQVWPIEYNNYNKYMELRKENTTKVAVLGYENTGKSFLLSKLTDSELPQGALTKTVGLCLKYPTGKSRPWTALDTPGTNISVKTEQMKEKLAAYFAEKNLSDEDRMRMLLGDNILMENLLQEFVVRHAQVLLVVIGKLHRDDQRLINRIKSLQGKRIIIVHNLMEARHKEDVEDLIREDILDTFSVTERPFYIEKIHEGKNRIIYLENDEKNGRAIEHIVMAHEGSPAGNYYNESAFYYIKTLITSMPFAQTFDMAQAFLEHLNEKFRNYLQARNTEIPVANPFFFENDENGVPKQVKLQRPLTYDLKLSSADEFGQIRTFSHGGLDDIPYTVKIVSPEPNVGNGVKAVLRIEIEIAGEYEAKDIKYKLHPMGNNQARMEIKGKSGNNSERGENVQILENHRKFGDFNFVTESIDLEKFVINPRETCGRNNTDTPGLMILSWNLYEPADSE